MPEGIASDSVDGTCVARIGFEILLWVWHWAHVDGAVLSCSEIGNVWFTVLREVDGETTSVDECHSTSLLFSFSSSVNIFLVGVCFTFQLHEFSILEPLTQRPLNNFTISWDRDETFSLVLTLDPLDIPNDVCVLEVKVFWLSNRFGVGSTNIVDSNIAAWISNSNQMRWLFAELATSDTRVVYNKFFREVGIL